MVQAIDQNRKFHTRRIQGLEKINQNPSSWHYQKYGGMAIGPHTGWKHQFWDGTGRGYFNGEIKPKYNEGDILWVRETWAKTEIGFVYKAKTCGNDKPKNGWKPSIFMPKEAARFFLKVTGVKAERLQDISREDAIAEGIERFDDATFWYKNYLNQPLPGCSNPITSFQTLWMSINGVESWQSNPWVWVYEFKKIAKPTNWPL